MKHIQSILLSITVTALIVGSASYYFFYEDCQVAVEVTPLTPWDDRPDGEPPVTIDTQPLATGTLSYYVPEMGLRFEYPAYATVTVNYIDGTSGSLISGRIRFSLNQEIPYAGKYISFGSRTKDFSWPKGCDSFCGVGGFSKIGGEYYYGSKGAEGGLIPTPERILTKDGVTEALMIMPSGNEGPGELARGTAEVIINTKNTDFSGLGFIGSIETPEDRALFESIIRSIELE